MATFQFKTSFNGMQLDNLFDGALSDHDRQGFELSTLNTVLDGYGDGLQYVESDDGANFSSGVIRRMVLSDAQGPELLTASGLSIDVATLMQYFAEGNRVGVFNLFTSGDDRMTGSSETDTLVGGDGNDTLNSNGGADTLYGNTPDLPPERPQPGEAEAGNADVFVFDSQRDSPRRTPDVIMDLEADDYLDFTGLGIDIDDVRAVYDDNSDMTRFLVNIDDDHRAETIVYAVGDHEEFPLDHILV